LALPAAAWSQAKERFREVPLRARLDFPSVPGAVQVHSCEKLVSHLLCRASVMGIKLTAMVPQPGTGLDAALPARQEE
ncbi:hypothetical protein P7K49_000007, partial [Saguinus oedipus]